MLNLDYYIVDVGDNCCDIAPMSCKLSLRDAILERDKDKLYVIKEYLVNTFKRKSPTSPLEEFKFVFVNKEGKYGVLSDVENDMDRSDAGVIVRSKKYDIYLMKPGQTLNIRCAVYPKHVECLSISYSYICSIDKLDKSYR